MEVTRTLAKFIVEHRYADIPEKVRHEAARSKSENLGIDALRQEYCKTHRSSSWIH